MKTAETLARTESGLLRILTPQQMRTLQRLPDGRSRKGRRDAAILGMLSHGLRAGEVAHMRVEHVLPGTPTRLRFASGKTGRVRTVTLTPTAGKALRKYMDVAAPRAFLFAYHDGFIATRTIQRLVKGYGDQIGVPDVHPHMLRHSTATTLVHATNDIWKTAAFLGHTVQTCSRFYSGYLTKDADECADALATAK